MCAAQKTKTTSETSAANGYGTLKLVVLFTMIIIGLFLILYRSSPESWQDQFVLYNQLLFGISMLLMIVIIIFAVKNLKKIILHEVMGFIVFLVGALVLLIVPGGNFLGLGDFNDSSSLFFPLGGVIIAIGTILLMRSGGFVSVCLLSVLINVVVSAYYAFGEEGILQYHFNAYLIINFSIIFFIIGFILLVYHDVKFFYLVGLIKEGKKYRSKKDYKKALGLCDKALKIYPYFATAWNNKGNILVNMGKKDEAIKCYKKALDINPTYLPAMRNMNLTQRGVV